MKEKAQGTLFDLIPGGTEGPSHRTKASQREALKIHLIDLELIKPNPFEPRKIKQESPLEELAASIRRDRLLCPVLVRREQDGTFTTLSGELRHVRMNDRVLEILRGLPGRLKSEWVFPSETGESPLNANNFINRIFNPALKQAKIIDFHWHDLRHTFASRLTLAGVDLRTLQELMGHKTIKMTLRYSHLSPTHTLEAVNKLCLTSQASGTRTGTEEKEEIAGGM